MKKQILIIPVSLCLALLSACSSKPNPAPSASPKANSPSPNASVPLAPQVQLPNQATWRCTDGSQLETRLSGSSLQLRYQGREYHLNQAPSARPAIYENTEIAFFSDGESAAVGNPQSAVVMSSGCRLGGR